MNMRRRKRLPEIFKTVLKIPAAFIGLIIVFAVLYFTAVLIGGLLPGRTAGVPAGSGSTEAWIILDDNGRHIDVWLPAGSCTFMPERIGWYGFGWGDRDFFLNTPYASDVRPGILLKALFLPSRSVLAVQHASAPPGGKRIAVSAEGLEAAAAWINSRIETSDGRLKKIPDREVHSAYTGYVFFEARGWYTAFYTSNNWANEVLKKAGHPVRLWTPLTFGID